ncbi:hypothetical protein [Deinococcus aerophilus]|nr:hypothetical protein [Deinococcus aerophilus]
MRPVTAKSAQLTFRPWTQGAGAALHEVVRSIPLIVLLSVV